MKVVLEQQQRLHIPEEVVSLHILVRHVGIRLDESYQMLCHVRAECERIKIDERGPLSWSHTSFSVVDTGVEAIDDDSVLPFY